MKTTGYLSITRSFTLGKTNFRLLAWFKNFLPSPSIHPFCSKAKYLLTPHCCQIRIDNFGICFLKKSSMFPKNLMARFYRNFHIENNLKYFGWAFHKKGKWKEKKTQIFSHCCKIKYKNAHLRKTKILQNYG